MGMGVVSEVELFTFFYASGVVDGLDTLMVAPMEPFASYS